MWKSHFLKDTAESNTPITNNLLHMANPTITVFTLPKITYPNRVRPAVPKSLRTATAA